MPVPSKDKQVMNQVQDLYLAWDLARNEVAMPSELIWIGSIRIWIIITSQYRHIGNIFMCEDTAKGLIAALLWGSVSICPAGVPLYSNHSFAVCNEWP